MLLAERLRLRVLDVDLAEERGRGGGARVVLGAERLARRSPRRREEDHDLRARGFEAARETRARGFEAARGTRARAARCGERETRARASRRRSARVLAGFDGGLVIGDGLDLRRHVGRRFLRSDSHLSVARSGAHGARVRAPVRVIRTEQVAGKSSAVAQLVAVSTSNSDFYNSARAPAHVAASAVGARSRSARSQDRTAASCSKRRTTFSRTRRRRSRRASASVAKRTARRT